MKHTTTLLLLLLTATLSIAQEKTGVPNTLDAQYTPAGSGVLTYNKQKKASNKSDSDYPGNIIKFTPTLLARSLMAVQYERKIGNQVSLCGSFGYSYNNDIVFTEMSTNGEPLFEKELGSDEIRIKTLVANTKYTASKPHFGLGVKFLNELEENRAGGYIQINYDHWGYNAVLDYTKAPYNYHSGISTSSPTSPKFNVVGTLPLNFSFSTITLRYGFQIITDTKLKTSHEFYFSFGGKLTKFDAVTETLDPNSLNNYTPIPTPYKLTYTARRVNQFSVYADIGYAFGFGFGK
ncbi:MAG: hypothetical protein ABL940_09655 [Bacteroidia bacterium]